MKAIKLELQIKRVTINKEDSISFSAESPALTDEELGAFRKLSKVVVNALLEPQDGSEGVLEIKERVDGGKTPSQRLRSVLFLRWEQLNRPTGDFDHWYKMAMEKIINEIKEKLDVS